MFPSAHPVPLEDQDPLKSLVEADAVARAASDVRTAAEQLLDRSH